jgi:Holliday junction DNA helicase RuvA
MISRLRGSVWCCEPGRLQLDVGGVGYDLQIPLGTYYRISEADPSEVELHVYTHVREDAITLFGFATTEERSMFLHLTSISGVGPRLALSTLSGIGPIELCRAVRDKNHDRILQVPGIGKKTAARIVLELRDRLDRDGFGSFAGDESGPAPVGGDELASRRHDAVSALSNLGYSDDAARRAVDRVLGDAGEPVPDLQDLLRSALRGLNR